ncbi:MAG: nucleotidyltransferase domain-containing protein [Bacteroidales bacterium]
MNINEKILTELKSYLLQNLGNDINDIILFGSRINNNYSKDSDYDILIILNKNYDNKYEDKIIDLCYDIDLKYNILIDPHILSTAELNTYRGKQPIFINAINNGIHL